jgi:penicillin amidase
VYVKKADVFVPMILKAVEKKRVKDKRILEAAKILREWDRYATIDQAGPCIFYDTMGYLTDLVLMDDFDKKDYKELVKDHAGMAVMMMIIRNDDEFFDDKNTKNRKENRNDILVRALEEAVWWLSGVLGDDMEKWRWGDLHTIKWYHPMGFLALKEMSIGPFPHPGGNSTVRAAASMGFGDRKYMCMGGPVLRHIIDFGDPDNALVVIDGGQSGQWLSPHYRDMTSLWYNSEYMIAEKRPEEVIANAESVLTLKP